MTGFSALLASDLHGSSACFRKAVALAIRQRVDVLIIAGDWSGKHTVFLLKNPDGSADSIMSNDDTLHIPARNLKERLDGWRDCGSYPVLLEAGHAYTPAELMELEERVRVQRLRQWLEYAQGRMRQLGMSLLTVPGNDDGPEIEAALCEDPWLGNLDERVHSFRGHEIFGLGYSNVTPWQSPRELSEDELEKRLARVATQIADWPSAIGVIHVPPLESGLDLAPDLEMDQQTLRPSGRGLVPIGSSAVREFIKTYGPLAVFSGHCHESRGFVKVGGTSCVNPGSQCHVGTLCACLLRIGDRSVLGHQFFVN
jgi:Icc-related predicted phosphoesterase